MSFVNAIRRAVIGWVIFCLAVIAIGVFSSNAVKAQEWPYGGIMPNIGAMSYDLRLTQAWSPMGIRMTGFASSAGGHVRWVHCLQSPLWPFCQCRLMVDGGVSEGFSLPPQTDLGRWLAMRFGGPGSASPFTGGPTGAMETSGQWRWGAWTARGRFLYWR